MSKLANGLTPRQERFCQFYAEGTNGARAALLAGYKQPHSTNHAYRLRKQPRIRARIAAIQADLARESCRATEVLLGKLEIVFQQALESRNYAAASRAVDLQSRITARHERAAVRPQVAVQAVDSKEKSGKMAMNDDKSPKIFFGTVNLPRKTNGSTTIRKAE